MLRAIGEAGAGTDAFARRGVTRVPRLVPSELTTLSVCDLASGHRSVVSDQPGAIPAKELEAFDHFFFEHPLVREPGRNPQAVTKRASDLMPASAFLRSPLYNEYYGAIGIDHVMALPIHVDRLFRVSFVPNRSGRDFADRERALLEVLRPHLANLHRLGVAADRTREAPAHTDAAVPLAALPLTSREREVLDWVAAGKTNRDIVVILGASPRTVEKHLERIYEKLSVETRTAAVMRALRARSRSENSEPN